MKTTTDLVLNELLATFFYLDCYLSRNGSKRNQTMIFIFLAGRLKGVKTIGKPSWGRFKGGRGRLIEVAAK